MYSDIEALVSVMLGGMVFFGLIGLVFFIIKAVGLYTISKNRGLKLGWLAFIPVLSGFTMGRIADDINARIGKKSYYRIVLLILGIVSIVVFSVTTPMLIDKMGDMMYEFSRMPDDMSISYMMSFYGISGLISLVNLAVTIITFIVQYKIYSDYVPRNAAIYIVVSVFVRIAETFFIFSIRNKQSISIEQQNAPLMQQIII